MEPSEQFPFDESEITEEQLQRMEEAAESYAAMRMNVVARTERFEARWCAAGGTREQWDDVQLWIRAEQLASIRTNGTQLFLGPVTMMAADDLMDEAIAALKAGRLDALKAKWFPYSHS